MAKTVKAAKGLKVSANAMIAKQRARVMDQLSAAGYTFADAQRLGCEILHAGYSRGILRVWLREAE